MVWGSGKRNQILQSQKTAPVPHVTLLPTMSHTSTAETWAMSMLMLMAELSSG